MAILRSGIWCSSLPERGRALNRRPAACRRRSDLQVIALCASGSLVRASHQAVLIINGLRLQLRTRQSRPPLRLSYPEMSAHGFKLRQPPAQGSACIELLKVCHLTLPAKGKALVIRPQKCPLILILISAEALPITRSSAGPSSLQEMHPRITRNEIIQAKGTRPRNCPKVHTTLDSGALDQRRLAGILNSCCLPRRRSTPSSRKGTTASAKWNCEPVRNFAAKSGLR